MKDECKCKMFREPLIWWKFMTSQQLTGTKGRECKYFMFYAWRKQLIVSHLTGVGTITSCYHQGWITLWSLWCEAPVYCCVDRGKLWAHNVYYDWNNNSSYRKSKYSFDMQSLRELWSESFCLSLQKYESERLLDPTGGSPDVVHLIKYVSLVLGWLHIFILLYFVQ